MKRPKGKKLTSRRSRSSIKLNSDTWKDSVLNSEIHLNNTNQTYDILFMVEATDNASRAAAKFYYGSKMDPLNEVKAVAYEDIIYNIRLFSETPLPGNRTVEKLYNLAAMESVSYLDQDKLLPGELVGTLIKLQMMFLLDQDVLKVFEQIMYDKDLEEMLKKLVEGDKKATKGKCDPCDPNSVNFFKSTSTLKPSSRAADPVDNVEVPSKHIFFVIIGFYDYGIFEELFSRNVPVGAVVELVEPEVKHICGDICNRADCNVSTKKNCVSLKEVILMNFWNTFCMHFEAEDYPKRFDGVFHMTVQSIFESNDMDDNACFKAFIEIGGEIVKLLDIKRRYLNYVRNLKICEIDSVPKCEPIDRYTIYRNTIKSLPSECFNVQILLDTMLEEFSSLPSNPYENNLVIDLETPKYHFGIKNHVVNVLNQQLNCDCISNDTDFFKMNLPVTRKPFLVDPNNEIYIAVNPYHSIQNEYLKRNGLLLQKSKSSLLWKKYLLPEEMKILTNKYHLKTMSEDLDISLQELQYIIHVLLFLSIKCSEETLLEPKTSMNSLFPPLQDAAPNITKYTANFTNETQTIEVNSREELNKSIPNLTYSLEPNTYEAKNMENFKWYEKLCKEVMLQELYKAERLYLCFDYKYSVFDDSILLRFHNELDDFGINRKIWTQSLRTYLGIKEFCKYIIHEEAKWLEIEEIKYMQALEEECRKRLELEKEMKENLYGKLEFSDEDFIQPGSFKAKMREPAIDANAPKSRSSGKRKSPSKDDSSNEQFKRSSPSKRESRSKHVQNSAMKSKSPSEKVASKAKSLLENALPKTNLIEKAVPTAKSALEKSSLPTELTVKKRVSCAFTNKKKQIHNENKRIKGKLHASDEDKLEDHLGGAEKESKIRSKDQTKSKGFGKNQSLRTDFSVRETLSVDRVTSPPYSFYAYDISNQRLQLTGSTIVFCSQDGVKVTVDQTRFLRESSNISVNISADGHSLIVHKNKRSWSEPFTFHFCLSDLTIIAFGKPSNPRKPEEKLTENIYSALERDSNKRQNLFFISDVENHVLKCFNIPFVTKKNLILSEQLLPLFLNHVKKKRIPLEVIPSRHTLKTFGSCRSTLYAKSRKDSMIVLKPPKKGTCQSIGKVDVNDQDAVSDELVYEEQPNVLRKPFNDVEVEVINQNRRQLLQEIQKAMEHRLPIFKICSSKLHRSQYVQRVKSYVEVHVGSILKRIGVKPRLQRVKRKINISKVLPIKPLMSRSYPKYEMKICLPSGLTVESVAGFQNDPFCIRQKYVYKGPQCVHISHEISRTYMRNGSIVIKNSDGDYNILYINGSIMKCDLPHFQENRVGVFPKKLKKVYSLSNLAYLHAYGSDSQKFKKYLQRVIYRLEKHMIGNPKTRSFKSYGDCNSGKMKLSLSTTYLLQTNVTPFTKFSLLTSDGKSLKVTKTAVVKEQKFFISKTKEYRYDELLFDRDDGTQLLFNRDSELFVQFPDGTRISSWVRVEEALKEDDDEDESRRCYKNKCDVGQQISLDVNEPINRFNGWVFIILSFKFEHPYYGTVVYDGGNQSAQIILPENLEINISKEGEYHVDISKRISATVTASTLIFETQLCSTCLQKCVAIINVEPLYNKIHSEANSDEVEFIQVTDSFNKKFVLNFDGSCYNNVDYIRGRFNSVRCPIHNPYEYQKLFLLKRDLNGCRFWDVADYRYKIKCSMDDPQTTVKFNEGESFQTFFSTTFSKKEFKPIDQKYLLPYKFPRLVTTASKTEPADQHFFSKIQILKKLPELSKVLSLYKALLGYGQEKDGGELLLTKELDAFIANILIQNAEEQKVYKQKQAEIDLRLELEAAKVPPIPLSERWRKWKQEVHFYLNKIRSQLVPQYRVSKLRNTLIRERRNARQISAKPLRVEEKSDIPFIPHICCRKLLEQVGDTSSESTEMTTVDHGRGQLSVIIEADEEIDATERSKKSRKSKMFRETKKEQLFKIPLAVSILNEVTWRFSNFIRNVVIDEHDTCSENKVQYVAEKIYGNILRASKELENEEMDDFVNVASEILVNNICLESLNTIEMYALLDHLTTIETIDDVCKLMFDSTVVDCLEKYKLTKETKTRRKSKITLYATDSAYELYSWYAMKTNELESEYVPSNTPKTKSLTIVYEAPEEKEKSIEKIVTEKNKFLLRSSYTNLLQNQSPTDFCEKCINKADFYKNGELNQENLGESSSSSIRHESKSSMSFFNTLKPHISPDSTILNLSPDVITDIDSRTHVLQKDKFIPPESMRVLFSILSLKDKDSKNAGPYVERNPNLIEEHLSKITQEKERNDSSLLSVYGECNKCIGKYNYPTASSGEYENEEIDEDYDNVQRSKSMEWGKSDESVLSVSDLSIRGKSHVVAKVGDEDLKYIQKGCPPTYDQALHVKERKYTCISRQIIRKSVGMVTQADTTDNITQT
ncbi:hypothetical protein FQR65_LT06762 [Abscondita terminalis]|nr:hypothetical protein FQR65_LT06762 [Abscondita terminalis]